MGRSSKAPGNMREWIKGLAIMSQITVTCISAHGMYGCIFGKAPLMLKDVYRLMSYPFLAKKDQNNMFHL